MIFLAQSGVTTIPLMLQLGVGGIFAILILRLVFDFVDRRERHKEGMHLPPGVPPDWAKDIKLAVERQAVMGIQIQDLHDWHKPEAGVQEWKNRAMVEMMREFKIAMERVAESSMKALESNNQLLKRLIPVLIEVEKKI